MITLKPTADKILVEHILNVPELKYLNNFEEDQYIEYKDSITYLLAFEGQQLLGMITYWKMTDTLVDSHIYILPEFHGNGTSLPVGDAYINYIKDCTQYLKIITYTPSSCKHVIKFLEKNKFNVEGFIRNAVVWHGELNHYLIYTYNVRFPELEEK